MYSKKYWEIIDKQYKKEQAIEQKYLPYKIMLLIIAYSLIIGICIAATKIYQ